MSLVCEEVKSVAIIRNRVLKPMFAVFYACVIETEDDGIFVDSTYFGGTAHTREVANVLVQDITNDKNIQGAVVPKVLLIDTHEELSVAHDVAQKQFTQMARDMYAVEEMNQRGKKK